MARSTYDSFANFSRALVAKLRTMFAAKSAAVPAGGTAGQALVKASDVDNDCEWADVDGESGGGMVVAASAPSDTSVLWIDSSVGGVAKYWDGAAWTPCKSVWG